MSTETTVSDVARLTQDLKEARDRAIDECTKVAETQIDNWEEPEHGAHAIRKLHGAEIAKAIRALKEKQT